MAIDFEFDLPLCEVCQRPLIEHWRGRPCLQPEVVTVPRCVTEGQLSYGRQ